MASGASAWAEKLAREGKMSHNNKEATIYTENIQGFVNTDPSCGVLNAVRAW